LPKSRPRLAASRMPSTVRDRIRSDSNSASEPKMWKTSRPPGGDCLDQVGQRPTQPVQAPHREGVPRAQCGHHLRELRPGPRRGVGPRPPAPRGAQRVVLQRRVLHRGRHPRVPQQLPHEQRQCHNPPKPPTLTRTFRSRVPQQQASPSTCGSKLRLRPPRPRVKNDLFLRRPLGRNVAAGQTVAATRSAGSRPWCAWPPVHLT